MTVSIDVEGYAAEQQLKKLAGMSMVEQDKLRADRKRKKKERMAILAKIETLKDKVCDECKIRAGREANGYHCDCPASLEMRDLGKRLAGKPEKAGPKRSMVMEELFRHINGDNITWDIYLDMKDEKVDDRAIMRAFGWSSDKFYAWKKAKGEIAKKAAKKIEKPAPKKRGRPKTEYVKGAPIKELTVDKYLAYKKDKRSDSWVQEKYKLPNTSFTRWKKLNELSGGKTKQATDKLIEQKGMNDVETVEKSKYEALQAEYEKFKNDHDSSITDLNRRIDKLRGTAMSNLEIAEAATAERDMLKKELSRLKDSDDKVEKKEYLKLVLDFGSLEDENKRLKRMLERLKNTERMNLWMMEQYVGLYEQVDEVMA